MTLQVFLGIRLPDVPYYRMPVNEVDPKKPVSEFKTDIETLLNSSNISLELIYRGDVLADDQSLLEQNIRNGSTIHVMQRKEESNPSDMWKLSEADISAACIAYSRLKDFSKINSEAFFPEALSIVLDKYPELNRELGALAIIKNCFLMWKLRKRNFILELAKIYPILIKAAEFIVQTYNATVQKLGKNESPANNLRVEDDALYESDISMESDDEATATGAATRPAQAPPISRDQLADALLLAGSAVRAQAQSESIASATNSGPSTSNNTDQSNLISNDAFSQALNNAYISRIQSGMTTPPAPAAAPPSAPSTVNQDEVAGYIQQSREQYASELQIMREMGLMDVSRNIQALIVCNGDVESAINFVLAAPGGV